MDHSSYLTSHRKQKSPKEESHGHKIREAEKEIQAALPRYKQHYREADRRVTRTDKRPYMEYLASQAKEAANTENQDYQGHQRKYHGATYTPID